MSDLGMDVEDQIIRPGEIDVASNDPRLARIARILEAVGDTDQNEARDTLVNALLTLLLKNSEDEEDLQCNLDRAFGLLVYNVDGNRAGNAPRIFHWGRKSCPK
jgi:hypothetical protein